MKKHVRPLILTILLIALAFIAMETNPTTEQYTTWLKNDYIPSVTGNEAITEVFAQIVGPTVLKESTITKDYVFFSIYEIHLGQDTTKLIGAFNNFFILQKSTS